MIRRKSLFSVLLLSLLVIRSVVAGGSLDERKKTIVKVYDVSSKDQLIIDNQFGNVNVNLWNRDEIRVDITITAASSSDERIQQYLDAVEIIEKRTDDQISLKTQISRGGSGNWVMIRTNTKERNFIQIDYQLSIPKNNPLTIKNQFGNVNIPTFRAPLTVMSKYGGFYATDLHNSQCTIDIAHGKAEIREMKSGKLTNAYSSLQLDKATAVFLNHQFGKLKIGEVAKLDGKISYSPNAQIDIIRDACKIRLEFSSGFRIGQLAKSVENVDIEAAYSDISLPLEEVSDYTFDLSVTHGSFQYPEGYKLFLTSQPSDDENRHRFRPTKQYSGKVGKGNGTRIRVISTFGDVKFQ